MVSIMSSIDNDSGLQTNDEEVFHSASAENYELPSDENEPSMADGQKSTTNDSAIVVVDNADVTTHKIAPNDTHSAENQPPKGSSSLVSKEPNTEDQGYLSAGPESSEAKASGKVSSVAGTGSRVSWADVQASTTESQVTNIEGQISKIGQETQKIENQASNTGFAVKKTGSQVSKKASTTSKMEKQDSNTESELKKTPSQASQTRVSQTGSQISKTASQISKVNSEALASPRQVSSTGRQAPEMETKLSDTANPTPDAENQRSSPAIQTSQTGMTPPLARGDTAGEVTQDDSIVNSCEGTTKEDETEDADINDDNAPNKFASSEECRAEVQHVEGAKEAPSKDFMLGLRSTEEISNSVSAAESVEIAKHSTLTLTRTTESLQKSVAAQASAKIITSAILALDEAIAAAIQNRKSIEDSTSHLSVESVTESDLQIHPPLSPKEQSWMDEAADSIGSSHTKRSITSVEELGNSASKMAAMGAKWLQNGSEDQGFANLDLLLELTLSKDQDGTESLEMGQYATDVKEFLEEMNQKDSTTNPDKDASIIGPTSTVMVFGEAEKTPVKDGNVYNWLRRISAPDVAADEVGNLTKKSAQNKKKKSRRQRTKDGDRTASGDRRLPCGECACCRSMRQELVHGRRSRSRHRSRSGIERSVSSVRDAVGVVSSMTMSDLLHDDSSSAAASTVGPHERLTDQELRMRDAKQWLQRATDEFVRRRCIRQVVLRHNQSELGCRRTKVTRISRPPSSLSDCAATGGAGRAPPGQLLQLQVDQGQRIVADRLVDYRNIAARVPPACDKCKPACSPAGRERGCDESVEDSGGPTDSLKRADSSLGCLRQSSGSWLNGDTLADISAMVKRQARAVGGQTNHELSKRGKYGCGRPTVSCVDRPKERPIQRAKSGLDCPKPCSRKARKDPIKGPQSNRECRKPSADIMNSGDLATRCVGTFIDWCKTGSSTKSTTGSKKKLD